MSEPIAPRVQKLLRQGMRLKDAIAQAKRDLEAEKRAIMNCQRIVEHR